MKVKDAIKALKELDKEEEIIIAWWEQDVFTLNKKEWKKIVPLVDSDFDWSATHDDLTDYMDSFKD